MSNNDFFWFYANTTEDASFKLLNDIRDQLTELQRQRTKLMRCERI